MQIITAELPIEMFETKTGVVIGSKYNGSQEFRDTTSGVYFESMPAITGQGEKLQAAILEWPHEEHKRIRRSVAEGGYCDDPYRPWPTLMHQRRWDINKQNRDNADNQ